MSKKLQEMPIFDRLYPGGQYKRSATEIPQRVSPELFQYFSTFHRFKLTSDQRVTGWHNDATKFGELRLPFKRVWIEWSNNRDDPNEIIPSVWQAAICVPMEEFYPLMASIVSGHVPPQKACQELSDAMRKTRRDIDIEKSWAIVPFILFNGVPILCPLITFVNYGENWEFQGLSGKFAKNGLPGGVSDVTEEQEISECVDMNWDALVAVGWLNCKNVTTKVTDRTVKSKRRHRPNADRAKGLNFRTIQLPGHKGEGESTGYGGKKSLHTVRGHFKTFTKEKPLMGKAVGTYWWGWQVRGSREIGTTVSDYAV